MKLVQLGTILAATRCSVVANPENRVDGRSLEGVGAEVGTGLRLGVSPAYPDFLQDKAKWSPFSCEATQNMCDSCTRDCACTTGNCSWNFVCYGSDRRGTNGCFCKFDSDCTSGRCSKNLRCDDKVKNGSGCLFDNDCESVRCSSSFKCSDKLDNNKGCLEDDDCASGRCSKGLTCQDKLENDQSCGEPEDCKSRNCEWFTCRPDGCDKEIPFMITNIELTMDGPDHFWGYHNDNYANEFQFLKNIKYCENAGSFDAYRIYGELVSPEEFKTAVTDMLEAEGSPYDHVLYSIHGFQTEPKASFEDAHNFNKQGVENVGGYLVIPVNWRNRWGLLQTSYEYDRNNLAPMAGEQLARQFDAFKSSYSASAVVHSMGNYVFRNMAHHVKNPEQIFQNVFMVAADARSDMFGDKFNPAAAADKHGGLRIGWYLAEKEQPCSQFCQSIDLQCGADSLSKQTALTPSNTAGTLAAFNDAGISCDSIDLYRDYPGSPLESQGKCVGFGTDNGGTSPHQSTCDGGYLNPGQRRLCYCENGHNKGTEAEGTTATIGGLHAQVDLKLPDEEMTLNGGYDITKLTNHTHVVWNKNDKALLLRELFQIPCILCVPGSLAHIRHALGKYGDEAEKMMNFSYFRERVTFHDLTPLVSSFDGHLYQWDPSAEHLYKGNKFQKGTAFLIKTGNDQDCDGNSDCASGFCGFCDGDVNATYVNPTCQYGPPLLLDTSLASKGGLRKNQWGEYDLS